MNIFLFLLFYFWVFIEENRDNIKQRIFFEAKVASHDKLLHYKNIKKKITKMILFNCMRL